MSEFYYSCSESEVNTVHYILIQRNYKFILESILANYRRCQEVSKRRVLTEERRRKALQTVVGAIAIVLVVPVLSSPFLVGGGMDFSNSFPMC